MNTLFKLNCSPVLPLSDNNNESTSDTEIANLLIEIIGSLQLQCEFTSKCVLKY